MSDLIKSASVIRQETNVNDTYKTEITKCVQNVMSDIERAKNRGLTKTGFSPGNYKYEQDIKKMFRDKGYTFLATGYIGGVLQQTEDICW